jgi:serine/threonine protein kinase/CRP-like cAMP-binding protein
MVESFGRYEVLQPIAQGGMAEILLARPLSGATERCALKRILPQFSKDLKFVSMFIDEARITIGLDHENVVRLFDFGQVDGVYFMAIEYVDGTDLAALLQSFTVAGRALPPIVAASIAADVARGLGHAHALCDADGRPLGVVHRDVSPHNVLLSSTGEVKLTDFGIAAAKNKLTLTTPGVVLGKAAYMAPEQATGRGVDAACDLWALGVILWESLVGSRLFAAENPVLTLQRMMRDPIAMPSTLRPEVPAALDEIVARLLQRDKNARPRSAAEVAVALDAVVATLARTSPLARNGSFGRAERAALVASVDWSDDTAPMRPRVGHAVRDPEAPPLAMARATLENDRVLGPLVRRFHAEQDGWLLVDVGDRALKEDRREVARSAYRTAAAVFASRGLLVQCLVAHAGARALMTAADADDDVMKLGDLAPGRRDELDALLATLDGHGFSSYVVQDEGAAPPSVPLLGALGPRELARLAAVIAVRRVKKGDIVIREGDLGNELYAVARGRFVVSCAATQPDDAVDPAAIADAEASEATLDSRPRHVDQQTLSQQHEDRVFLGGLADGDFFGEFSFLVERPRSATVEAVTDGLLLEIEREDVEQVAAGDPAFTAPLLSFYKERVVELMMAKSPVFSLLGASDRRSLLDGATLVDFTHDAVIVREGTRNDALYFIRRGEVEVFRRDKDGLTIFINKLVQGQFFGEIAALRGTPRTVSIRAIGPVSLFRIEGRLLHEVVRRQPHLKTVLDAMIERRAAETTARVLEHDLLLMQT